MGHLFLNKVTSLSLFPQALYSIFPLKENSLGISQGQKFFADFFFLDDDLTRLMRKNDVLPRYMM